MEVLRFAPSPNGPLHLGHALSAIVGHGWARRVGGRFLLRIEDIDQARSRETFTDAIVEDLIWLGIRWDGTPVLQSQRMRAYAEAASRLSAQGLLYPCFATRGEIAAEIARRAGEGEPTPLDPDGTPLFPGLHRDMSEQEIAARKAEGQTFALRLDMRRALDAITSKLGPDPLSFVELSEDGAERIVEAHPERWGDAVIVRKDTPSSYHLSVVVDDAWQGVTTVTRGQDLYAATDLHRLLQVLLDLPEPRYHHHPLLTDALGRKLSKSAGAEALATLRKRGLSPGDVYSRVGRAPLAAG